MATVKLVLDKRRKNPDLIDPEKGIDNNKYPFRIRIFKDTDFTEITLPYKFTTAEWIENENRVDKNYSNSARVNSAILERYSIVSSILSDHEFAIEKMDLKQTKKFVEAEMNKKLEERVTPEVQVFIDNSVPEELRGLYLEEFGKTIIKRSELTKEFGTAKWYKDGIDAIKKFNGGKDILLYDITIKFLNDFEALHISIGNNYNGFGPYLRAVRSITNKAIKEELKNKRYDTYPWAGGYSIKSSKTKPKPIRVNVIDDIRKLTLDKKSAKWNARNYLLFMFNNRGMNFIDLAQFKKHEILNAVFKNKKLISGRLKYFRSKTNEEVTIGLTVESIQILNDYNIFEKGPNDFVFPIGFEESKTGLETYRQKRKRTNRTMTELAADAKHPNVVIKTYTIRYTFGTELRRNGFGMDVVQRALAQRDSRSAQCYTEDYEDTVLDRVTEIIVTNKSEKPVAKRTKIGDKRVAVI